MCVFVCVCILQPLRVFSMAGDNEYLSKAHTHIRSGHKLLTLRDHCWASHMLWAPCLSNGGNHYNSSGSGKTPLRARQHD